MNEYGEIQGSQFVQSVGHTELEHPLHAMFKNASKFNVVPKVLYTDMCCTDRRFFEKVFPSLMSLVSRPRLLPLPDNVKVMRGEESIRVCLDPFLDYLKRYEGSPIPVGLDTEWNMEIVDGKLSKVGKIKVIQLAINHSPFVGVYVIQTHDDQLPNCLVSLLKSRKLLKVGNRILSSDVKYLAEDFGVSIDHQDCVKLNLLAKEKGFISDARVSLKDLTLKVLGFDLEKNSRIRLSNKWHLPFDKASTKPMADYAARDAWASLLVFEKCSDMSTLHSASTAVLSDVSPMKSSEPENESLCRSNVLQDPIHAIWRVTKQIPRHHPLKSRFCRAISEAIFKIYHEDKEKLDQFLKTEKNSSFQDTYNKNPRWVLRRVRRKIVPVEELVDNLKNMLDIFTTSACIDQKHGPLLNDLAIKKLKILISDHAAKGCLADPSNIPLYYSRSRDKDTNGG